MSVMQDYPPVPDLTKEGVEQILSFLPLLESAGPGPGLLYTVTPLQERDGVMTMPYVTYSPEVLRFLRTLFSTGFGYPFDWGAWQDEAVRYVNDPDLLKNADLDTLRKLVTLHVRRDRFFEGHLAEMIDQGHILAILYRLKELYS